MIDKSDFVDLATNDPAIIRVVESLDVDIEPLAAYAALTGRTTNADRTPYTFLLESAEKVSSSDPNGAFRADTGADRHARYSFVGYDPVAVLTVQGDGSASVETLDDRYAGVLTPNGGDVVDTLRDSLPDLPRRNFPAAERQQLDGGLVGFLAYDAVYDLWLEEVGVSRPESAYPDAQFVLNTKTIVFDDAADTISLVCTPIVTDTDAAHVYDTIRAEVEAVASYLRKATPLTHGGFTQVASQAGGQNEYEAAVRAAKEHVLDGDIYQGVISRSRELHGNIDVLGLYAALRDINPSPYMYLLEYDDRSIVGASPETLISVRGRNILSNPIAGTCSRGASPVEDRRLAGEMLADEKELAEHTMLVDLARNDVRRVAAPGSVGVDEFMNVLKYSHVQHIESTVTGQLASDCDAFDATRAAFPAGTLAGAPKIRAMEIIDALEETPRGVYGGGVGYYSWDGDADFAIVIRTATIEHGAGVEGTDRVTVRAGAGLVADSDPTAEYEETEKKMDGVIAALDRLESMEDAK